MKHTGSHRTGFNTFYHNQDGLNRSPSNKTPYDSLQFREQKKNNNEKNVLLENKESPYIYQEQNIKNDRKPIFQEENQQKRQEIKSKVVKQENFYNQEKKYFQKKYDSPFLEEKTQKFKQVNPKVSNSPQFRKFQFSYLNKGDNSSPIEEKKEQKGFVFILKQFFEDRQRKYNPIKWIENFERMQIVNIDERKIQKELVAFTRDFQKQKQTIKKLDQGQQQIARGKYSRAIKQEQDYLSKLSNKKAQLERQISQITHQKTFIVQKQKRLSEDENKKKNEQYLKLLKNKDNTETELRHLNNQISSLQQYKLQCQKELQSLKKNKQVLSLEILKLGKENNQLVKVISENSHLKNDLQKEIGRLMTQNERLTKYINQKTTKTTQLAEIELLKQQKDQLLQSLVNFEYKKVLLDQRITAITKQNQQLKKYQYTHKMTRYQQKIDTDVQNEQLKSENNKLKNNCSQHLSKIQKYQKQLSQIDLYCQKIEIDNRKLTKDRNTYFSEKEILQKEKVVLLSEINKLKYEINQKLNPQITALKKQKELTITQKHSYDLQKEAMRQQIQQNAHTIANLEEQNKGLQNQNNSFKLENEKLREQPKRFANIEPQVFQYQEQIKKLKMTLEESRDKLEISQIENKKLQSQNMNFYFRNSDLQMQLSNVQDSYESFKQGNKGLAFFKSQQNANVYSNQYQPKSTDEMIKNLNQNVDFLNQQLKNEQHMRQYHEKQNQKIKKDFDIQATENAKMKEFLQKQLSKRQIQNRALFQEQQNNKNVIMKKITIISQIEQKNKQLITELNRSKDQHLSERETMLQDINYQRKMISDYEQKLKNFSENRDAHSAEVQLNRVKTNQFDLDQLQQKMRQDVQKYQQNMQNRENENRQLKGTILSKQKEIDSLKQQDITKLWKTSQLEDLIAKSNQQCEVLQKNNCELKQQVKYLTDELQNQRSVQKTEYTLIIQRYQTQLQQIIKEKQKISFAVDQANTKLTKLTGEQVSKNTEMQLLRKSVMLKQEENQRLKSHIEEMKISNKKQIQYLTVRVEEKQKIIKNLQTNNQQMFQNTQLLTAKYTDIEKQKITSDKKYQQILEEKANIQTQLKLSQRKYKQIAQQQQKTKNTYNQLRQNFERLQGAYKELQFKSKNSPQKKFSVIVNNDIQKTKRQLSQKILELNNLKSKFISQTQEISSKQKQIAFKDKANEQLKSEIRSLLRQLSEKSASEPIRQVSINESSVRHLFHGDVLRDNRDDYKLFLKKQIQNHAKIQILDTRLVCRYDPLNEKNLHCYIDLKSQLVVVIKLVNGYYIACYSEGIFKPKTLSDKSGLIISLNNKKSYQPSEKNKRAIVYDDYFVIFGNSEVRIKSQEKKLFSNFGLNSSYYRHLGDGVSMLLGGGPNQREIEFDSCEYFQLILKQ